MDAFLFAKIYGIHILTPYLIELLIDLLTGILTCCQHISVCINIKKVRMKF